MVEPEREMPEAREREGNERAKHHHIALGEIDDFSRLVDQDETEGDQCIDASDRNPCNRQLQDLHVSAAYVVMWSGV